ncbi:MAG: hypothetical protein DHS20C03_07200 [Minwuia thermotolerans]|nr:MAG: hypothetical protein DHS20C03_07200 [Minwuia thermotolerans]
MNCPCARIGIAQLALVAGLALPSVTLAQQGTGYSPHVQVLTEGAAPCALDRRYLAQAISRALKLRQGTTPIRTKLFVRVRSVWKLDGCHDRLDVYYSTRRDLGSNARETFFTPHSSHHQRVEPLDARPDRYRNAADEAIRLFDRTNRDLNLIPMN